MYACARTCVCARVCVRKIESSLKVCMASNSHQQANMADLPGIWVWQHTLLSTWPPFFSSLLAHRHLILFLMVLCPDNTSVSQSPLVQTRLLSVESLSKVILSKMTLTSKLNVAEDLQESFLFLIKAPLLPTSLSFSPSSCETRRMKATC